MPDTNPTMMAKQDERHVDSKIVVEVHGDGAINVTKNLQIIEYGHQHL